MDDKPASLLTGRVLAGRYRLVRLLGQGGMGAVYEAVQEGLGRRVAVKVLHKARLANANAIVRFRVEAETAARIASPHIVLVTDFHPGGDADPPFLVMELLEGKNLHQLVEDGGALSWQRAARVGAQVLAALASAHEAKILHRDIKPDNVFVSRSPALGDVVKVLDFGVAKLMEEDGEPITGEGMVVGTPEYMAPEQVDGRPLDARTDLYAVAACLYEAVSGVPPIKASDSRAQLDDVLHREPAPLERVSASVDPRFARIVMRGLAKDPDARFRSADEMARALGELVEGVPVAEDAETLRQPRADAPTRDESATSAPVASEIVATRPNEATMPAVSALRPLAPAAPITPVIAGVPPMSPAPKRRSRVWLWIALGLALLVATPTAGAAAIFRYYIHLTNVCLDPAEALETRLDACTSACGPDENRQYCTVRGDLLVKKGDVRSAASAYAEACDAGDTNGCARAKSTKP